MTRASQIARHRCRIDGDANGRGAVGRGNARGHAEARGGVNADRERRLVRFVVVLGHLRKAQGLAALGRQRHADETAGVRRHEVDHCGAHLLRRADQISFILASLVISHDDEFPRANIRNRLFYRSERHSCLTYFPSTSASTCTRSPFFSFPNVVCSRVNGTSET
jgi:hypothetical protein